MLYLYPVYISVTLLRENGKRLSPYAIRTQMPAVGWLHYELCDYAGLGSKVRARLLTDKGADLLDWLDHARLVACRGQRGALIEGVQYRKKGTKHSVSDRQAWWCEAPPRRQPLLENQARILAHSAEWQRQIDAGWGFD